jgi:Skp family chaperone for outer membrane proteins
MKKTCIAALVLGVASATWAQEPKSELRSPKIAVVDFQRIQNESLPGKALKQQLQTLKNEIDAKVTKIQNDIQKIDTQIKAMQEELQKVGASASPEFVERKQADIVKKQREGEALAQDGRAEVQRDQAKAEQQAQALQNDFQGKIKPTLELVAKEKGLDLLLDSQIALTINANFDISQDVIVKANEQEAARAKTGAAKPAAAAPAAAKPAPAPAATPQP